MNLAAIVLLCAPLAGLASEGCPCLATPANPKQTSAPGKPAYVGEAAAYGWGCKAHDEGEDACNTTTGTADGESLDWCLDEWCIVDKDNCDLNIRLVAYTADANDYFAYEACEKDDTWKGNGWIGRCKNCNEHHADSFNAQYYPKSHCSCGGMDGCKCSTASKKQSSASGKPAYVGEVPSYGYGCMAHDEGEDACENATTTDGSDKDWCADQWCIVDKDSCDFKTRPVVYSAATDDYFSYETCDSSFEGNGWVGRCKCKDQDNSFCDDSADDPCKAKSDSEDTSFASSSGLAGAMAALAALAIL